ncbi:MAG: SixA phosphatase family protein [Pseudomonadota bacterium]
MDLVLIRHGEAERDAASDSLRRLTARGEAEAMETGRRLQALELPVPVVVSSPYRRARSTADLIAIGIGAAAVRELPGITPDDDPRRAALAIAAACTPGSTLVVVTHMPLIGSLLGLLLDDDLRQTRGVRTAGGAVLTGDFVAPGLMRVRHVLD